MRSKTTSRISPARRKLFAMFEATTSPNAAVALQRIAARHAIEAEIHGQPAEQRRAERQAFSRPLLHDLHEWMPTRRRRLRGKSPLGTAMQYALNRWEAAAQYLEDGRLPFDNNLAERQRRGIALTRKYYLFLRSDAGGERAAVTSTVAGTARLNGLDPEACIAAVPDRPARGHTIDGLDERLPRNIRPEGAA
jgi:hypothetical protein